MENRPRRIGLLLVHGMGEQRRLEHLRGSARELASFIARVPGLARVSFDDRTYEAPEEVIVDAVLKHQGEEQEERVQLCLREVFWADLGIGGGLVEQVKFWLWGLGQWAGEAMLKGDPLANTEQLMAMPRFGHQQSPTERPGFWRGLPGRLMLFGAALLAILTFFTWSAAKRLVSLIARRLPEPSLIFLFLGDVKIYERPGGPGKGTLLDPDMPMRATIRRRMVSAMTAMAAGGFDDWYTSSRTASAPSRRSTRFRKRSGRCPTT